jgi:hypothetical protein
MRLGGQLEPVELPADAGRARIGKQATHGVRLYAAMPLA